MYTSTSGVVVEADEMQWSTSALFVSAFVVALHNTIVNAEGCHAGGNNLQSWKSSSPLRLPTTVICGGVSGGEVSQLTSG